MEEGEKYIPFEKLGSEVKSELVSKDVSQTSLFHPKQEVDHAESSSSSHPDELHALFGKQELQDESSLFDDSCPLSKLEIDVCDDSEATIPALYRSNRKNVIKQELSALSHQSYNAHSSKLGINIRNDDNATFPLLRDSNTNILKQEFPDLVRAQSYHSNSTELEISDDNFFSKSDSYKQQQQTSADKNPYVSKLNTAETNLPFSSLHDNPYESHKPFVKREGMDLFTEHYSHPSCLKDDNNNDNNNSNENNNNSCEEEIEEYSMRSLNIKQECNSHKFQQFALKTDNKTESAFSNNGSFKLEQINLEMNISCSSVSTNHLDSNIHFVKQDEGERSSLVTDIFESLPNADSNEQPVMTTKLKLVQQDMAYSMHSSHIDSNLSENHPAYHSVSCSDQNIKQEFSSSHASDIDLPLPGQDENMQNIIYIDKNHAQETSHPLIAIPLAVNSDLLNSSIKLYKECSESSLEEKIKLETGQRETDSGGDLVDTAANIDGTALSQNAETTHSQSSDSSCYTEAYPCSLNSIDIASTDSNNNSIFSFVDRDKAFDYNDQLKMENSATVSGNCASSGCAEVSHQGQASLESNKNVTSGVRKKKQYYFCSFCEKSFSKECALNLHVMRSHKEKKKNSFTTHDSMNGNKKVLIKEVSPCGHLCNTSGMTKHMKQCHKTKRTDQFFCSECEKYFSSKGYLKRHRTAFHEENNNSKTVLCSECDLSFISRTELHKHLESHRNDKGYSCYKCRKSFHLRSTLKAHLKTHKSKSAHSPSNHGTSLTYSKNNDFEKRTIKTLDEGTYSHECNESNLERKGGEKVDSHQRDQSSNSVRKRSVKKCELKSQIKTPISCLECGKTFASSYKLTRHQRYHSPTQPFSCPQCPKSFSLRYTLDRHVRSVHNGNKPQMCPECGKTFSASSDIIRHLRTHTGEKPHPCQQCDKSFSLSSDLKRHVNRIHTEEKPHLCRECDKSFNLPWELKRHLMRVHQEKCHACLDCHRSYSFISDLNCHRKTHHGKKK